MNIRNKKLIAILMMVLGILFLFFSVKTFIDNPSESEIKNEGVGIINEEESHVLPEDNNAQNTNEDVNAASINTVTFDNITSILKYDIHPEIEALLDVEKFDKELTSFLQEKNAITYASHETPIGVFICRSSDFLTKDIKRNVYLFDLKIDNKDKSIVSVSVSSDGYVFDIR